MSFDKSLPCAGVYPVLPEMLDDDDDYIVREVKMLSLITAQEEQDRRQRLNRELNLAGRPSDASLRSHLTLQESSSLPELVGNVESERSPGKVEASAAKAAIYSQIARPRPQSGRSVQGVEAGLSTIPTSGGAVVPPPLPTVRPNARSRIQTDPIRIPSPPRTVQQNRQEVPTRPRDTSANRSQSLSPPFHRTNLTSCSILDDFPAQGTSLDAPLICLSPPARKYNQVEDFDLESLDPFQPRCGRLPPALHSSPVTKTVSDKVPQNRPRPSADPKVLPYRNSPVPSPLDGSPFPTSPFFGGNDAVSGQPVFPGFMPWVTNDLCSPSSPGFSLSRMTDPAGNIRSSSEAEIASRHMHSGLVAGTGSGGSDLMDFTMDCRSQSLNPAYMDLADFDPLYTVDGKAWSCEQRFESDELFLKSGNPLPQSTVVSTARPAVADRPSAPLPDVVAQSSMSRLEPSMDELQDPFSVQDLMVSLERKRQQHACEQEAQSLKAVASQRSPPVHNVSATNAALSKRKVLSPSRSSYAQCGP